jgi:hypothetical protein
MPQSVRIAIGDIVLADNIAVHVAAIPSGPSQDTLLICTGTAVFDFEGTDDGINKGVLQFFIPREDSGTNPLDVSKFIRPGGTIHEATVASLASFTGDTGPWAVDAVEVLLVPGSGSEKFLQLTAGLAVGKGSHILRVAYQANVRFLVT